MLSQMLQDENVTLIDGLGLLDDLVYNNDMAGVKELCKPLYTLQEIVTRLNACYYGG